MHRNGNTKNTIMKKSKKDCDLKSCFFCKLCLTEWLPAVSAHRKTYHVKKGERFFNEGDPVNGIYFVYSGKVKVHKKWGPDKELIVRFAEKGSIIGHRGLGHNSIFPVSGTAIEPSIVCFIDIDFFQTTLKVNTELTYNLMMFFADELQDSERKMRNLAHMPVKGRVAQALLTLQDQFGIQDSGVIDIELTRQDLASFAGTTYESVFRIINDLVIDKLISVSQKSIVILDQEGLFKLTQDAII